MTDEGLIIGVYLTLGISCMLYLVIIVSKGILENRKKKREGQRW